MSVVVSKIIAESDVPPWPRVDQNVEVGILIRKILDHMSLGERHVRFILNSDSAAPNSMIVNNSSLQNSRFEDTAWLGVRGSEILNNPA